MYSAVLCIRAYAVWGFAWIAKVVLLVCLIVSNPCQISSTALFSASQGSNLCALGWFFRRGIPYWAIHCFRKRYAAADWRAFFSFTLKSTSSSCDPRLIRHETLCNPGSRQFGVCCAGHLGNCWLRFVLSILSTRRKAYWLLIFKWLLRYCWLSLSQTVRSRHCSSGKWIETIWRSLTC